MSPSSSSRRSPSRSWGLVALLALGGLTSSCGTNEPASDATLTRGVQHLDPRLADGSSSAQMLGSQLTVHEAWRFQEDLAPWVAEAAEVRPAPTEGGGVWLTRDQAGATPGSHPIHLVLETPVDAAECNLVELDVQIKGSGSASVRWRPQVVPEGVPSSEFLVETNWDASPDVQTLRFPLADRSSWRGRTRSLRIVFQTDLVLHGIRLVNESFSPGHQPSSDFGEPDADGGLLGFEGDERRTWPSDFGVPLVAPAVTLPKGARVTVACALPGSLHGLEQRVFFALDVRRAGGAWEARATRSLVPAEEPAQARWQSLTADLADLAGEVVDVRLRSWLAGPEASGSAELPGTQGELHAARVWWAVPMVLGEMHAERRPNLVLVTVDTTRTDAIGAYGGPKRTPFLDQLAETGVLFEKAWSACNSTLPSHTSILTGLEVPVHGLLDNRSLLAPEVRTLAQALRADGYQTAAAVSVPHLQAGYSGLGRGFDQYLAVQPGAPEDGALTLAKVSDWLAQWSAEGDRPFFLWVHLFDPHTPYGPPKWWLEDYVKRYALEVPPRQIPVGDIGENVYTEPNHFLFGVNNHAHAEFLYQAGVTYSDELLQRLDQNLTAKGFGPHTALVITSDHGESLGEGTGKSEVWYSHQMLFDPILHVPLLMRLPDGPRGKRVTTRVSTLDLAGSFSRYLGVRDFEPSGQTVDLLALANGDTPEVPDRRVWFVHSGGAQLGLKDDGQTYFENLREYMQLGRANATPAGMAFLYEPESDPGFEHNLAEGVPARSARLSTDLAEWKLGLEQVGETLRANVSAAEDAALEALGYLGDESPASD